MSNFALATAEASFCTPTLQFAFTYNLLLIPFWSASAFLSAGSPSTRPQRCDGTSGTFVAIGQAASVEVSMER
jgi:hypothetical protein